MVMIEQDPIHPQIPLAHVRSDEVEEDAHDLYHLVAPHRRQEPDIIAKDAILHLELAHAQCTGTEELLANQEDHLPMTVMTQGVAHALIIERDQDVIMTGAVASAPAAVAAKPDTLPLQYQEAKVQRPQDREIERDVALCKDMHLQAEEGAILHQCPYPLTNDARQLTLLGMRTQSQRAPNRKFNRPRQAGKLRWVVVLKSSSANVLSTSSPLDGPDSVDASWKILH